MKSLRLDLTTVAGAGLFIAAFGLLYMQAISGMVGDWNRDPNYSHGFLVPLISGYFVWQKKDVLLAMTPSRSLLGLFLALGGLAMFLVGSVAGESFTIRMSMIVVLSGALLFALGWPIFRELLLPLAFLVFMVPLPYILYDTVAFPLRMMITKYSVEIMKFLGVAVMREGNIIHLTNTSLEVADACSGIRSIISLLALATAMAYLFFKPMWKRIVLVALAIPMAVFANGVRVVGTGVLASHFGPEVAQGFFHEFAGLAVFALAMAMLVGAAGVLSRIGRSRHG
ncbi:exosortase A [Geoalkalibacter sp.]|uniref:exosortase A n=1 Tax=Geoalkalibacter sp. TaxID=3041440 RepID=UPI00272E69EB|nr:exosortase A [Geoalkalibacter sp.]